MAIASAFEEISIAVFTVLTAMTTNFSLLGLRNNNFVAILVCDSEDAAFYFVETKRTDSRPIWLSRNCATHLTVSRRIQDRQF